MLAEYRWTDGSNEDFRRFYLRTEAYYSSIVGGLENRMAFVPYNFSETISDVIIAYVGGMAVGCAGLKAYKKGLGGTGLSKKSYCRRDDEPDREKSKGTWLSENDPPDQADYERCCRIVSEAGVQPY